MEKRKKPRGIPQGPFHGINKIADRSRDSKSFTGSWPCPQCEWGTVRRGQDRWLCLACGLSIPGWTVAALTKNGPAWIGLEELVSALSALPHGGWSG